MIRFIPLLVLSVCAIADESDYQFRDDDRPAYEKTVTVDELSELPANATVLDVRLQEDFDADPVLVPGASYRNPENIRLWTKEMSPSDGSVFVYCVRGKWVSQKAATYLSEQGFDVYTLEGGIEAWKASGRKVEASRRDR